MKSVPTLSQESIRLLDGLDIGDHVRVLYIFEGLTLVSDGTYRGIRKTAGKWLLCTSGQLASKWTIPIIDVIDIQRAG